MDAFNVNTTAILLGVNTEKCVQMKITDALEELPKFL